MKIGDRVKAIHLFAFNNQDLYQYYPPVGTIGKIVLTQELVSLIEWPKNVVKCRSQDNSTAWWYPNYMLEVIE